MYFRWEFRQDVFQAQNGWPSMNIADMASPLRPLKLPHKPPALDVDLNSAVHLKRERNGEIIVAAEITNRGLTGATNVEITDARLDLNNPVRWFPVKRTYLAPGRRMFAEVALPNLPKGADAVLSISGRYLSGTFDATLRVKLP